MRPIPISWDHMATPENVIGHIDGDVIDLLPHKLTVDMLKNVGIAFTILKSEVVDGVVYVRQARLVGFSALPTEEKAG